MEREWSRYFNFDLKLREIFVRFSAVAFAIFLFGCKGIISSEVVASNPVINQPTFSGRTSAAFTANSIAYVLNGECDKNSLSTQWSSDLISWTDLGSCATGSFSINLTVTGTVFAYARAKTKSGFTGHSQAEITYVLPPTAMQFSLVGAGYQGHGNLGMSDIQYGVEHTMTADVLSNANGQRIQSSVVDSTYEP